MSVQPSSNGASIDRVERDGDRVVVEVDDATTVEGFTDDA